MNNRNDAWGRLAPDGNVSTWLIHACSYTAYFTWFQSENAA